MPLKTYDPINHLFTEEDATERSFYNGDSEFSEEAKTLIRFKQGSLTLQEADSILLNLARVPNRKFTVLRGYVRKYGCQHIRRFTKTTES